MDKQQAEQALSIIRDVIDNTREDLVAHNWGLIWVVHSFTNSVVFASIGLLVERNQRGIVWYLLPLAILAAVNLTIVAVLTDRDRGVRSYIEWQLHGIWLTFIIFTLGAALVVYLTGASPSLFCPLVALTSGIGFALMGVMFYRRFFVFAVLFLFAAPLCTQITHYQWFLLAAIWWGAMFVPGVIMVRERRRRRQQDDPAEKIL